MSFGGNVHLMTADPDVVQALAENKNYLHDQTGLFARTFREFFGDAFQFSKCDEVWK